MRILVTGAAGFIGTNFVHYWVREHPDDTVVALDALTYAGSRENLADIDVAFVHADVGDTTAVEAALREHAIDTVVNFAAESHNSLAVLDPGRFLQTNVLGTQRLLDACRSVGVTRFHHISTCEVYGDLPLDSDSDAAFTEQSPYRPRTPYNASKAGSDHVVRAYHETFDVPVTITNCANNYGPYQFPEKVLPLFITYALQDRPLPIYTSADHRREWLHVRDHCTAIDAVLHRGRVGATYNVGSGLERTVTQLADDVLALLGKPHDLRVTVPDRPGHDRRYLLDSSVLRTELGWRPEVDFAAGLADTVRWYAEHSEWWSPLQQRSLVTESSW